MRKLITLALLVACKTLAVPCERLFSVQPPRTLCLCGVCSRIFFHHRDTEVAQRITETFTS